MRVSVCQNGTDISHVTTHKIIFMDHARYFMAFRLHWLCVKRHLSHLAVYGDMRDTLRTVLYR